MVLLLLLSFDSNSDGVTFAVLSPITIATLSICGRGIGLRSIANNDCVVGVG